MGKAGLKRKAAHGLREFLLIFTFLAPWLFAFSTYRMLLLKRFGEGRFEYGTDLVNALILSKVVATGEFLQLGRRHENKALLYSTIWKSFLFASLAAAFSIVEHIVKGVLRGGGIAAGFTSPGAMGAWDILGRSLVIFFAFIPFFALRETVRVLGEGKWRELFLGSTPSIAPHECEAGDRDGNPGNLGHCRAVLFDMDGVVTDTASVHAECWKTMFDEFLLKWAKDEELVFRPFDIVTDYSAYVDGKPRYNGVRDFLMSRGITLPEGRPEDPPTAGTVCGLGNRKDELVSARLAEGVEAYPGSVALLRYLRRAGVRTAVVTSSQNCRMVLHAAGVEDLFDARVDGVVMAAEGLAGKPAPDSFLRAAEMLGVSPKSAAVLEDALAGVQAAAQGGFGLVIGVDRRGNAEALRANGAEIVVRDLSELLPWNFNQPLRPAA